MTKITRIRRACGPNFGIWSGNDDLALATVALGGQGVISVTSNAIPNQVQDMMAAALDGDFDTAAAMAVAIQPLNDHLFCQVNPIPIKAAMEILGYDCGECRLPLTGLNKEFRPRLEALLRT